MKILNWLKGIKREVLIKNSFLIPILLVVIMSISHVVSWYNIGNPFAWAIYLSVAIEIFALSSVSAASININRASVWVLFALVTFIQIIGNIFFEFNHIDQNGTMFKSWVDLVKPFFDDWTLLDHRRLFAIVQGGTIPMMSLIALNYYIKFGDKLKEKEIKEIKGEYTVRGFWNKPDPLVAPEEKTEVPEKEAGQKINKGEDDEGVAPYASLIP
jgi:hypothetical protein